jgi:hypothetical protein
MPTMNTRRCLKISARMNGLLRRELGEGIEPARMLAEPLYARDVLLVCDALRGSELAELAARFRRAMVAEPDASGPPGASGFSASRFLSSIFGGASTLDPLESPAPPPSRRWFGRARSSVEK